MNTPWELLAKYFTKEANEAEKTEVKKWSQSHEDNSLLLEKLNLLFKKNPKSFTPDFNEFKDQDWEKLYRKTIATDSKTVLWPMAWKLAASISFIIVALTSILLFTKPQPPLEVATTDYTKKVWLPDSSYVLLNKNSKLIVASDYLESNRKVSLIGEAFFKVKSNPESPFSVSSFDVSTTVLGTEFNVNAKAGSLITISVLQGKVSVIAKNQEQLLTANMSTTYDGSELQFVANADPNYLAWKTGIIRFKGKALSEVAKFLSEHYNKPISIEKNIDTSILITVELNNLSIDQSLEIISSTLDLHFVREGQGYLIK